MSESSDIFIHWIEKKKIKVMLTYAPWRIFVDQLTNALQ